MSLINGKDVIFMIKKEWQRLLHNPLLIVVLAAIILIPSIYAGFFLASMWDPYGELDKLPVAVVNKDVAVMYDGEEIAIGDELVKNLKEDASLNYSFVDDETAQQGLRNGDYYMVITIPEDFSYNATTVLDDNPEKMQLQYETDPATNYVAMKLSESAMTKIGVRSLRPMLRLCSRSSELWATPWMMLPPEHRRYWTVRSPCRMVCPH